MPTPPATPADDASTRSRGRGRAAAAKPADPAPDPSPPAAQPPADVGAATALLGDWVAGIVPATALATAAAGPGGVICLLRELVPVIGRPAAEVPGARAPLTLMARYVLAARGQDAAGHDLIGQLAFARLEGLPALPPGTVDDEVPPPAWWQAHGLPPLPALALRVPVVRRRADPPIGIVRVPLIVRHVGVEPFSGRVLDNDGAPVPGALVATAGAPGTARTGDDGRFTIGVPNDRPLAQVLVTVRRRTIAIDLPADARQPVVLTLPALSPG